MPQPTPEELAEFDAKYKRTAVVRATSGNGSPAWCVVLRKPSRPEYKMLRAQSHDESAKADAQEVLFRKICVWPADVEALLDDWPGIPEACGAAILDLTGAAGKADAK